MNPDNQRWEEHWRDALDQHSPTPLPADWEAMESLLTAGQQAPPDPAPEAGTGGGLSLWGGILLTGLVALGIGLGYAIWPNENQVAQGVQQNSTPRLDSLPPSSDTTIFIDPNRATDGLVTEIPEGNYTQRSRYDTLYSVDAKGELVIASIDTAVSFSLPSAVQIDPEKPARPEVSPPEPVLINDTVREDLIRQEVGPKSIGKSTSIRFAPSPSQPRGKVILPLPPARSGIPSDRELWQKRVEALIESPSFKVRPYTTYNGYFPRIRSKFDPN